MLNIQLFIQGDYSHKSAQWVGTYSSDSCVLEREIQVLDNQGLMSMCIVELNEKYFTFADNL